MGQESQIVACMLWVAQIVEHGLHDMCQRKVTPKSSEFCASVMIIIDVHMPSMLNNNMKPIMIFMMV